MSWSTCTCYWLAFRNDWPLGPRTSKRGEPIRVGLFPQLLSFEPMPVTLHLSAVFRGSVAAGQLLAILSFHALHDRNFRSHCGDAETEKPDDFEGDGKRRCQR